LEKEEQQIVYSKWDFYVVIVEVEAEEHATELCDGDARAPWLDLVRVEVLHKSNYRGLGERVRKTAEAEADELQVDHSSA